MSTWFVVGVPHYSGAGGRTFPFYTAPICGRRGQGPGGLSSVIQPHFSHGEGFFGSGPVSWNLRRPLWPLGRYCNVTCMIKGRSKSSINIRTITNLF